MSSLLHLSVAVGDRSPNPVTRSDCDPESVPPPGPVSVADADVEFFPTSAVIPTANCPPKTGVAKL